MKKKSLRFKLIAGSIVCVVLPIIVIGWFSIEKATSAVVKVSKAQAARVADDIAENIDLFRMKEAKLTKLLSANKVVLGATRFVDQWGIQDGQMKINYLMTEYFVTGDFSFSEDDIVLDDITVKDKWIIVI